MKAEGFSSGNLNSLPYNVFLGGNGVNYLNHITQDFLDQNSYRLIQKDSLVVQRLNPNAHGYVVDIRIDGVSTHWMDNPYNTSSGTGILGNGTYKFTVEFNREMDTTVTPLLTFGIREPWTQNIVSDSSYWSVDGTEFNACVTMIH